MYNQEALAWLSNYNPHARHVSCRLARSLQRSKSSSVAGVRTRDQFRDDGWVDGFELRPASMAQDQRSEYADAEQCPDVQECYGTVRMVKGTLSVIQTVRQSDRKPTARMLRNGKDGKSGANCFGPSSLEASTLDLYNGACTGQSKLCTPSKPGAS